MGNAVDEPRAPLEGLSRVRRLVLRSANRRLESRETYKHDRPTVRANKLLKQVATATNHRPSLLLRPTLQSRVVSRTTPAPVRRLSRDWTPPASRTTLLAARPRPSSLDVYSGAYISRRRRSLVAKEARTLVEQDPEVAQDELADDLAEEFRGATKTVRDALAV